MSNFTRQWRRGANLESFVDLLVQRIGNKLWTVPKETQTKAVDDVYPAVAVCVPKVGPLTAVRDCREDHILP